MEGEFGGKLLMLVGWSGSLDGVVVDMWSVSLSMMSVLMRLLKPV